MKETKEALFFINSFSGGGAERVCYDLVGETCLRQNVKVVVLDGADDYGELPSNCQVLNLGISPEKSSWKRVKAVVKAIGQVDEFIGDIDRYDLVSAHLNFSQLVARLSKARFKTLYVMHGAQRGSVGSVDLAHRLRLKCIIGMNSQVVCVSDGIKRELVFDYSIPEKQCTVIHNPLNLTKINALAAQTECVTEGGPFVLAVGRLHAIKRFDRLLEAFSQLNTKNMKLVILGEGSERHNLERLAYRLGIADAVYMPGFSDNPYAWMAKSSAFVCCSDSEAFPVGLVEALYCGARVVSADCDFGPREILTGAFSEYLVNPIGDIGRYVERIEAALESYPTAAPSSFDQYSLDAVVDQYKSHWRNTFG